MKKTKEISKKISNLHDRKAYEEARDSFYKNHFKPGQAELIGHVMLIHLACEKMLVEYLHKANPQLGDLSVMQLSFSKILEIAATLKPPYQIDSHLASALRALNQIRNSLAHKHDPSEISDRPLEQIRSFYRRVAPKDEQKEEDLTPFRLLFLLAGMTMGALYTKGEFVSIRLEIAALGLDLDKATKARSR